MATSTETNERAELVSQYLLTVAAIAGILTALGTGAVGLTTELDEPILFGVVPAILAVISLVLVFYLSKRCLEFFDYSNFPEKVEANDSEIEGEADSIREAFGVLWAETWGELSSLNKIKIYYSVLVGAGLILLSFVTVRPDLLRISSDNFTPLGSILTKFVVICILGIPLIRWDFPATLVAAWRGQTVTAQEAIEAAYEDMAKSYTAIVRYWPAVIASISVWIIMGVLNIYLLYIQSDTTLSDSAMKSLVAELSVFVVVLAMIQIAIVAYVINPGPDGLGRYATEIMEGK